MDALLEQAIDVEVSDTLADKLLLNHQLSNHHGQKNIVSLLMSMAASILIMVGIGYGTWMVAPVNLSENAISHVLHEPELLSANGDVSFSQVNAQLATLKDFNNKGFVAQPAQILHSTYCNFRGVRSLHIVLQGTQGNYTLFIIPSEQRMTLENEFADNHFQGLGFSKGNTYMILVGENLSDLQTAKSQINRSFI